MPSSSESQRRLMGMALSVKRGEQRTNSKTVRKVAGSMTEGQLRDFAHRVETPRERKGRLLAGIARKRARGK